MGWLLGISIPVTYVLMGSIVGTRLSSTVFRDVHSSMCDTKRPADLYSREQRSVCSCYLRVTFATLLGLIWPLAGVVLLGWYLGKPRAQIGRAQRKLKALEADIAEREKELGIGRIA